MEWNRSSASAGSLAALRITGAAFAFVVASACFGPFTANASTSTAIAASALAFVIAYVAPASIASPSSVAVEPRPFRFILPFPSAAVVVIVIAERQLRCFPCPWLAPKALAATIALVAFVRPF